MSVLNVTAVIVTYNRLNLLKEALISVLNQTYSVNHVIIVNNFSNDGTEEYLNEIAKDNSTIIPINMSKNIGGAGGFYTGVKEFVKNGDQYVWLMDDDTIPAVNALEELLTAANTVDYNFGYLCSNVRWIDGAPALMNIPNPSSKWTKFVTDGLVQLKTCSFVSMLVPRSNIIKIGLPIREFFIWGDDLEYSNRLSNLLPSYFVARSLITHKMTANISVNIVDDKPERIGRYYYNYRNLFYINRHRGAKDFIKYIYGAVKNTFLVLKNSKNNRLKRVVTLWRGVSAGIFFKPTPEFLDTKENK